jgi:adenylate cyclase
MNTQKQTPADGGAFRVRRPLVAKLIAIISLIVLASAGAITAFATWFFAEDSRVRAEDQNLTFNELVAYQAESEVRQTNASALSLLDTVSEIERAGAGSESSSLKAAIDVFFARNPRIVYVGIPGEREIPNDVFFAAGELDRGGIQSFLSSNADVVSRAAAGESILSNASPWIGAPSAALAVPYRELGKKGSLVVIFSTESFQSIVGTKSVNESFIVGYDGGAIAHADTDLVAHAASLKDLKAVSACLSSPSDNLQFRFADAEGKSRIGSFHKVALGQFAVITSVPLDELYAAAYGVARRNLYVTAIVLLFSMLAAWFFSRTVSRPVLDLVGASRRIEAGDYLVGIAPSSRDEIGLLTESFAHMGRGLAERERIKEQFGKFVNREIAERALKGELSLGGVRKTATIFFSDIRSFTAISEKLAPEAVVEFLNDYMTRMVDCVERTHGVVDKFIGDAIMAVWGAPISIGSPAEDALECVRAMLMMRGALAEFNKGRGGPDKPVIRIGCGVNTGPCLAGQIGSAHRMEYTVIGDAVNLASRIEALNKPFATDILISEHTYALVRDRVVVEQMPFITVKGKSDPLRIYAVVNLKDSPGPRTLGEVRALLGIEAPGGPVDAEKEEVKYEILEN